jgi:hypothetical protein
VGVYVSTRARCCVFSKSTAVCAAVSCQQLLLLLLLLLLLQQCALCMYEATTAVMDLPILKQFSAMHTAVFCAVLYCMRLACALGSILQQLIKAELNPDCIVLYSKVSCCTSLALISSSVCSCSFRTLLQRTLLCHRGAFSCKQYSTHK